MRIEEFAVEGYTHVPSARCRSIPLRPMSWLPKIPMGLAQVSARLRCAECGGPLQSVKLWRLAEVHGKPQKKLAVGTFCCSEAFTLRVAERSPGVPPRRGLRVPLGGTRCDAGATQPILDGSASDHMGNQILPTALVTCGHCR